MRRLSLMPTVLLLAAAFAPAQSAPEPGLYGTIEKTMITVKKGDKGSPADGKIKVGDQIVGAGRATFASSTDHI